MKARKKRVAGATSKLLVRVLCFLLVVLSGCETPTNDKTPTVTGVTVSPKTATVAKGGSVAFAAVVVGANDPAQTVTWEVSGNHVAETAFADNILAVAAGETATTLAVRARSTVDAGKFDTATVTVRDETATVDSVTVSPKTATVAKGGSVAFAAVVVGANDPAQTVTWEVSGNHVAETAFAGNVLAVAAGETATTLTVRARSTVDAGKSDTATVVVEDAYVAVTGITGVPESGFAGVALDLGGARVTPANATSTNIVWTVISGTATIADNKLTAPAAGTLTLRGAVDGEAWDFTITIAIMIDGRITSWAKAGGIPALMPGEIQTVCYGYDDEGNGVFVAGSREADGRIAWSVDGVNWTGLNNDQTTFGRNFVHVKYLHDKFWAVGGGGHMACSEDGRTWTKVADPGITTNIVDIAWGEVAGRDEGVFVAGGDRGTMSYSTDGGATWVKNYQTAYFSATQIANVKAIDWGAGRFLAVGQYARAIYSEDGINWTNISPQMGEIFGSSSHGSGISVVAYSGGQYIIAGTGIVALSPDCENWEPIDMAHANFIRGTSYGAINSLVYAEGLYVIGGGDGKAAYSVDARNWIPIPATNPIFHNFHFINGLAYGKGRFVAVGATCTDPDCPNPPDSTKEADHFGDVGCIAYTNEE
jgi:uncharacterized protein YjdB